MRTRRLLLLVAVAIACAVGPIATVPAAHAATSRAVVVIGGSTYTISFNGTITGLQALQMVASVETLGYGGQGSAVCKINGVGNPAVPGECLGETSGQYWSYWKSPPGSSGWSYSGSGAGGSSVSDGSVEGWAFGSGSPPPYHSFCSVAGCAPPPPPPPPPPTAAPTPPPSVASGGTGASGADAGTNAKTGKDGTKSDKQGTDDSGGGDGATGTGSDDDPDGTSEEAGGPRRGGRPDVDARDADDGNSTVGIAVAGGVLAGLGGTGLWLRRRRRAAV